MDTVNLLFLNGKYIRNLNQLKEMLNNPQLINKESFRKEILSAYRDSALSQWINSKGDQININNESFSQDNILFKAIYKAILNKDIEYNLESDFSKYGEIIRCELSGQSFSIQKGIITLPNLQNTMSTEIRFVIKSINAENCIRRFEIKTNEGKILETHEVTWHNKIKGKEYSINFKTNSIITGIKSLCLVESLVGEV